MNWHRLIRRTIMAWENHRDRQRFFKAFPDAKADYIARKKCKASHKRGVSQCETRAFKRTFSAMNEGV